MQLGAFDHVRASAVLYIPTLLVYTYGYDGFLVALSFVSWGTGVARGVKRRAD